MKQKSQIQYLQLVTRHQASIYGYIHSIAPGASADDILQETNIVLWEKADDFEIGTNFKAFAFRIAHFKTLEALRFEKRRRWLRFDSDLLDTIAERHIQKASDDSATDLRQDSLRQCLAKLADDDRSLIHSRYTSGLDLRSLSEQTGRTVGALQQVFFRIRNALKSCIERQALAREGAG